MAFDDKFGYHEVLHTAHIMTCNWGDHIEGHGVVDKDPALKAEAERIGAEIAGFYQTVARAIDARFPDEEEAV